MKNEWLELKSCYKKLNKNQQDRVDKLSMWMLLDFPLLTKTQLLNYIQMFIEQERRYEPEKSGGSENMSKKVSDNECLAYIQNPWPYSSQQ